ncbi:spore coat U domain-containing protein [Orbus sturtevantii]|uniref:Csu type fimbrial protein n=1 Tax=Orbus sturtevantii TaxID=3074109 RepID=UPI00370D030B
MTQNSIIFCAKNYLPLLALLILAMPVLGANNCQLSSSASGCPILVQATILKGCQISGSTPSHLGYLDFGTWPTLSDKTVTTSLTFNSSIKLDCTPNTTLTISVDQGKNNNSGYNMVNSQGNLLSYQLYSDNGLTKPFNAGQPISLLLSNTSNNVALPIYGLVKLTKNLPPGNYNDTLTINISW